MSDQPMPTFLQKCSGNEHYYASGTGACPICAEIIQARQEAFEEACKAECILCAGDGKYDPIPKKDGEYGQYVHHAAIEGLKHQTVVCDADCLRRLLEKK